MTKWEYKVVDLVEGRKDKSHGSSTIEEDTEYANSFGKEGWELVAVTRVNPGGFPLSIRAYFKRESA